MSQGAEDEGRVGPEVVVHRADPGVVHVVVDTGGWPVNYGVDSEVVDSLPSVSIQFGNVLPHIASKNSIVAIVIQQLPMVVFGLRSSLSIIKSPARAGHRGSPGPAGS